MLSSCTEIKLSGGDGGEGGIADANNNRARNRRQRKTNTF